jgi:hypothetical protein
MSLKSGQFSVISVFYNNPFLFKKNIFLNIFIKTEITENWPNFRPVYYII